MDALSAHNLAFLEQIEAAYDADPDSVDPQWAALLEEVRAGGREGAPVATPSGDGGDLEQLALQTRVDALIHAYRLHGHLAARVDPLQRPRGAKGAMLELAYHGLGEMHLDREFHASGLVPGRTTLREIVRRVKNTYTRSIGVEYWHLPDASERSWLQRRMEACQNEIVPDSDEQVHLLSTLAHVENVDRFLHSKFLGAKRFSVSGAESMICALDRLIEVAADFGIGEVIFGMAHRGRLNVLMNILGKTPAEVFSEFKNVDAKDYLGQGDVKYHLGYHRNHVTRGGRDVYLALAFNPSHLEAITPVVQGRVRAKQDQRVERGFDASLGVTLHGDAAFCGQGVVSETLNLTRLEGYDTGGMIRIVANNQIGFTTDPHDSRSGTYCTDVAHQMQVPVFHINGDDPEAAVYVAKLAVEWRQRFRRDVIIDLTCYRRFGHNEGDDPTFTQPEMYERISGHPSVRALYQKRVIDRGTLSSSDCDAIDERFLAEFDAALEQSKKAPPKAAFEPRHGPWAEYEGGDEREIADVPTAISAERVSTLSTRLVHVPESFHIHRKIKRQLDALGPMYAGEQPLTWAAAELMAYASLVSEGIPIRMSGQDAQRGTFSHRHAVLTDSENGEPYCPLTNIQPGQGTFDIYNSPLSEFAVLGFEFGYSLASPQALVIWEAQFGDFANGAQVMIDQFISSSEDKWNRLSGLVLLLPHGYEGQGPEHSSARLERFLQLAAEDNMQVVNPTTPGQMFHLLRRQVVRRWRKPLIVMTPKSLLRFRPSFSPVSVLTEGKFHRVITDAPAPTKVQRVLLCSGKIYYDLLERRSSDPVHAETVAILRVEQLYPFPEDALRHALARLPNATEFVWVQDEPHNMGSHFFAAPRLRTLLADGIPVHYVGRVESASPATGSKEAHLIERDLILNQAFGPL
jgi:2-oxoglutarate dehydrogenase E1 component